MSRMRVAEHWRTFARSVAADVRDFDWESPRLMLALATGLATAAGVLGALLLNLDYPMWSAMSAFTVTQASVRATALKGMMRVIGTIAGALAGTTLLSLVAGSRLLLAPALFICVTYALFRSFTSPYPYAWLLAGITVGIILMAAMNDPGVGLHYAAYRAAEIGVGTGAAYLVSLLLLPPTADPERDRALARTPAVSKQVAFRTALEAGSGITLVVLLYDWFDLPGFSAAAVSMTRIVDPNPELGRHRGFLRIVGCAIGGAVALVLIGLSIETPFVLLVTICIACTAFGYFVSGPPGSSYAALQAGFAFVIAFAPERGPVTTLEPVIDRLAGIAFALVVFWLVDAIIGPAQPTPEHPGAS